MTDTSKSWRTPASRGVVGTSFPISVTTQNHTATWQSHKNHVPRTLSFINDFASTFRSQWIESTIIVTAPTAQPLDHDHGSTRKHLAIAHSVTVCCLWTLVLVARWIADTFHAACCCCLETTNAIFLVNFVRCVAGWCVCVWCGTSVPPRQKLFSKPTKSPTRITTMVTWMREWRGTPTIMIMGKNTPSTVDDLTKERKRDETEQAAEHLGTSQEQQQ